MFKLSRWQTSLILFALHKLYKISHVFLDDDIDSNNLPDDELEVYFNKLMPPAMQRGRVEGQEIPATVRHSVRLSCSIKFPCSAPSVSLHQKQSSLKKLDSSLINCTLLPLKSIFFLRDFWLLMTPQTTVRQSLIRTDTTTSMTTIR